MIWRIPFSPYVEPPLPWPRCQAYVTPLAVEIDSLTQLDCLMPTNHAYTHTCTHCWSTDDNIKSRARVSKWWKKRGWLSSVHRRCYVCWLVQKWMTWFFSATMHRENSVYYGKSKFRECSRQEEEVLHKETTFGWVYPDASCEMATAVDRWKWTKSDHVDQPDHTFCWI